MEKPSPELVEEPVKKKGMSLKPDPKDEEVKKADEDSLERAIETLFLAFRSRIFRAVTISEE